MPTGRVARAAVEQTPDVALFIVPNAPGSPPWADQSPLFQTVDLDDDDTAVILYTSGTTGQPKGAELRHRDMRDNVLVSSEVYRVKPDVPDTYLCALPLFHAFGQTCLQNGAVANGGTLVMMRRYEPVVALRLMVEHTVTVFAGVPTMYWALLDAWQTPETKASRPKPCGELYASRPPVEPPCRSRSTNDSRTASG